MKIAFVGASGYGNMGDDMYPLVFREHFPGHELLFFNSDLPESLPDDLELLVLGGGGLIYNSPRSPAHFGYMQFYMDVAREREIPWGFVGCGLQLRPTDNGYDIDALEPWVEYLRAADFLAVRSAKCVEIISSLTGHHRAVYFPDLGYLFDPIDARNQLRKDRVTLVPAGDLNTDNKAVRHLIDPFLSVGYELVVMGMGASCDDEIHIECASKAYPQAEIVRPSDPITAIGVISQSRFVITGRFHGMVFSRVAGVPFYVPADGAYKVREEDLRSDTQAAIGHIRLLNEVIAWAAESRK